jgi:hypothetical protein
MPGPTDTQRVAERTCVPSHISVCASPLHPSLHDRFTIIDLAGLVRLVHAL